MKTKTAREEIARFLEEFTPNYVGADYLREAERFLEGVNREHGPHPLVSATIKKLSARIVFLEIGDSQIGGYKNE
jgi:hypothetical protein